MYLPDGRYFLFHLPTLLEIPVAIVVLVIDDTMFVIYFWTSGYYVSTTKTREYSSNGQVK